MHRYLRCIYFSICWVQFSINSLFKYFLFHSYLHPNSLFICKTGEGILTDDKKRTKLSAFANTVHCRWSCLTLTFLEVIQPWPCLMSFNLDLFVSVSEASSPGPVTPTTFNIQPVRDEREDDKGITIVRPRT